MEQQLTHRPAVLAAVTNAVVAAGPSSAPSNAISSSRQQGIAAAVEGCYLGFCPLLHYCSQPASCFVGTERRVAVLSSCCATHRLLPLLWFADFVLSPPSQHGLFGVARELHLDLKVCRALRACVWDAGCWGSAAGCILSQGQHGRSLVVACTTC